MRYASLAQIAPGAAHCRPTMVCPAALAASASQLARSVGHPSQSNNQFYYKSTEPAGS